MTGQSETGPSSRDHLALMRTELANERTLLAYSRTGLAVLVGGLTIWQLTTDHVLRLAAIALGVIGIVSLVVGVWRYQRMKNRVRTALNR